jgi:hypothetical protein
VARPREFAYVPSLPNHGSKHQTPSSLYIDSFYAQQLLIERWTWPKFIRLCRFLKMTPYEVASLVMMPHSAVPAFERENILTCYTARPVALLLTLLEHQVLGEIAPDTIKNPFPNLNGGKLAITASTESMPSPVNPCTSPTS